MINESVAGPFDVFIEEYINLRKTMGYQYAEGERLLHKFSHYCKAHYPDEVNLTEQIVLAWAENTENHSRAYQQSRMTAVRKLGLYMKSLGMEDVYVLPEEMYPARQPKYQPYIFSKNELSRLFRAADCYSRDSQSPARHIMVSVYFRMLYCCGLRPGEALKLKVENIDLDNGVLKILQSKGCKDRIVVLSEDFQAVCRKFNELMEELYPNRNYFFRSPRDDKPYRRYSLQYTFDEIIAKAEINKSGANRPRMYDLRHAFATHCLNNWAIDGENINAKLPYLSAYMGHDDITSTAYYIHLLPKEFLVLSGNSTKWYKKVISEGAHEN